MGVFVFVGGYGWVGMCCYCALNLYMSNYTNLGDGIILGLRIDKEGQGQKRSLEARADAFSRLKSFI